MYVGDAERKAKDVDDALRGVVAEHGSLRSAQVTEFMVRLAKAGRYARDVC